MHSLISLPTFASHEELQPSPDQDFCQSARQIAKDVPRTFAGNPRVDQVRLWMAEVLRAHVRRDAELGYVQGMCFVAAGACVGCRDLPEADCRFRALMACFRPLWLPDFPVVVEGLPLLEELLREYAPGLIEHLTCFGVELMTVTLSGWLSLLAKWLPLEAFLEALPVIGREGLEGLLAASLCILQYHRAVLLHCEDMEEILRHFANMAAMQPPEYLVDRCLNLVPAMRKFLKGRGSSLSFGYSCAVFL